MLDIFPKCYFTFENRFNYQCIKLDDWNYTILYYNLFTQKSYNTYYTYLPKYIKQYLWYLFNSVISFNVKFEIFTEVFYIKRNDTKNQFKLIQNAFTKITKLYYNV